MDAGGQATLNNALLSHNCAGDYGGAVYMEQSQLMISNCTLTHNCAQSGGALYVQGNPLQTYNLSVEGSVFDWNEATCEGRAISLMSSARLSIYNCSFTDQSQDVIKSGEKISYEGDSYSASTIDVCRGQENSDAYVFADLCTGAKVVDTSNNSLPLSDESSNKNYVSFIVEQNCTTSKDDEWVVIGVALVLGAVVLILVLCLLRQLVRTWRLKNILLRKALPKVIAARLQRGEKEVDSYPNATIVFADIVDYTAYSSAVSAEELVTLLDTIFHRYDIECEECECLKVKTVGDCYMAAAGCLPQTTSASMTTAARDAPSTAIECNGDASLSLLRGTLFAWKILQAMQDLSDQTGIELSIRVSANLTYRYCGLVVILYCERTVFIPLFLSSE